MTKALIAFFSQGGTTRTIGQKIAEGLSLSGISTDFHDITSPLPDLSEYDLLGLGSPVYMFRPPFNVLAFIDQLPQLHGLPFFAYLMYGTTPGTAGNVLRTALSDKGGREIGYSTYRGKDLFLGYLKRGVMFSPDNPTDEELRKAGSFAGDIAGVLAGKITYTPPDMDRPPGIVYRIEDLLTGKFLVQQTYTYLFRARKDLCNGCGICEKKCPNNNISLTEKEVPKWGRNCIACLYCQMKCPKDAIASYVDLPVMAPFLSYNIAQGLNDPDVTHAKVTHARGKTKRFNDKQDKNQ